MTCYFRTGFALSCETAASRRHPIAAYRQTRTSRLYHLWYGTPRENIQRARRLPVLPAARRKLPRTTRATREAEHRLPQTHDGITPPGWVSTPLPDLNGFIFTTAGRFCLPHAVKNAARRPSYPSTTCRCFLPTSRTACLPPRRATYLSCVAFGGVTAASPPMPFLVGDITCGCLYPPCLRTTFTRTSGFTASSAAAMDHYCRRARTAHTRTHAPFCCTTHTLPRGSCARYTTPATTAL